MALLCLCHLLASDNANIGQVRSGEQIYIIRNERSTKGGTNFLGSLTIILTSIALILTVAGTLSLGQQNAIDKKAGTTNAAGCRRFRMGCQNIVCKCDAHYCDTRLDFEWPQKDSMLTKLTSDQSGRRFELAQVALDELLEGGKDELGEAKQMDEQMEHVVQLDINKRFQQIVGYGGAFTDSASMLIKSHLDNATRRALMESYFGPSGLDYNLARIPIGGTDMSWRPYSYNDLDLRTNPTRTDFNFDMFQLQPEDFNYKLPLIKEANEIRRNALGKCANGNEDPALRLLASSWSAPNWMKSNDNLVQGGLKDTYDGRYYDAYARYLIRSMDEYERELAKGVSGSVGAPSKCGAVKFWALTPQNEPCTPGRLGYSVVNYNSVNFEPKQMGHFVKLNLIPNLLQANRSARDLALFIWDDTLLGFDRYKKYLFESLISGGIERDNKLDLEANDSLRRKMETSGYNKFNEQTINDYVRGLALHWYSQALDKLPYKSLYDLRQWLPNRYSMISTEASFIGRPQPGSWLRAEKYARDIIENFRSGSIGWIDWNLVLNLQGGPTWSHNFLDAAILVDSDKTSSVFYKNPMFYAIGHLSRFVRAKSFIISSQVLINDHKLGQQHENNTSGSSSSSSSSKAAEDAGWRLIDEVEEQTSDLLVVASELEADAERVASGGGGGQALLKRRIALVLLNRSPSKMKIKLILANCKSPLGAQPLDLVLNAKSITSYAFNC